MIIIQYIIPVVVFSLLFNITKFISISPIGPTLQKIPQYLKFILFFQAFHPLTTTGLAPLLILISLNYKVRLEDKVKMTHVGIGLLETSHLENWLYLAIEERISFWLLSGNEGHSGTHIGDTPLL